MIRSTRICWSLLACCSMAFSAAWSDEWPQYDANPFVIRLDIPPPPSPRAGSWPLRSPADRLYVADVSGDWREEMVVLHGNELRVYHNPAPNPRPDQPRLWELPHYRRAKQAYNYYSP